MSTLRFKVATEPSELEQIHCLNYKTFVQEISQHQPNPIGVLVDQFDAENIYLICLDGEHLAGMMALRDKRPFSLDQKLENLDAYLPPGRSICELRLLAVDKKYRYGQVLFGLKKHLEDFDSFLEMVHTLLIKKLFQLFLFLNVNVVHLICLVSFPWLNQHMATNQ